MQTPTLSNNPTQKPKLMDEVRNALRVKHYSPSTEKNYINWIKRFIFFYNKRHPAEMSEKKIRDFLNHLAVNENVAVSTQNQALCAIIFLYREVLHQEIGEIAAKQSAGRAGIFERQTSKTDKRENKQRIFQGARAVHHREWSGARYTG